MFHNLSDSPFIINFSFDALIQNMEELSAADPYYAEKNKDLLDEVKKHPELKTGIADFESIERLQPIITKLLSDLFPPLLSKNEIKAINIPFNSCIINPTERLQKILNDAGEDFTLEFSGFQADNFYIMCCCAVLSFHYKINVNAGFPFTYDIPQSNGIINHYRILNNADFIEILPTDKSKPLSNEDITELLDNFQDIDLWREKFPKESWVLKGFGIINMFDATTEIAVSNLKSQLIQQQENLNIKESFTNIFRSIFQISDLEVGFTPVDFETNKFIRTPINQFIDSTLLSDINNGNCSEAVCDDYFHDLMRGEDYFSISDFEAFNNYYPENKFGNHFVNKGIKSVIFAPILKEGKLLGLIELTSKQMLINSVNANKINIIKPFLQDTMDRFYTSIENNIVALIQQEYTTIHPSVYWKFHEEVSRHIVIGKKEVDGKPFKSISFEQLIPLYGQADVKGSSTMRNKAIMEDLKTQIELISKLLTSFEKEQDTKEVVEKLNAFKTEIEDTLKANTETEFLNFLSTEVNPLLENLKYESIENNQKITQYFNLLDARSKGIYQARKKFDESVSMANKEIIRIFDKRQEEQQKKFPFYYERFKTDGVEHNMYIGASIAPWLSYDKVFLQNMRIWQLRVLCENEIYFNNLREKLPLDLQITSLILVYSTPINIRFRMDEKRFDVDGSYNARYEMIKKRIDKAHIKNTEIRITEVGKIAIVYSQKEEEKEYLEFIKILQNEGQLKQNIEIVEVEDLQGLSGLKAIRASINYNCDCFPNSFYEKI